MYVNTHLNNQRIHILEAGHISAAENQLQGDSLKISATVR